MKWFKIIFLMLAIITSSYGVIEISKIFTELLFFNSLNIFKGLILLIFNLVFNAALGLFIYKKYLEDLESIFEYKVYIYHYILYTIIILPWQIKILPIITLILFSRLFFLKK